jgi:hypothetical protein
MISSRVGIPSSISKLPGRWTQPETETTLVPGDCSVPKLLNQSAPLATMWGTLESVSTLLIRVGPP